MPRPWRIQYPGAKYHVTSRGNGRARIFLCAADYLRFLDQLSAALEADGVILYAYALLQNHIHLHLETPRGNLPRFMQRLTTAYSMYFRYKKSRPGHCFQGRYGAKLVEGDDYLVRLTRYIHLNPVKTSAMARWSPEERVVHLEEYPWSSYRSYVGLAPPQDILDYRWLKLMGRATRKGNQEAYSMYFRYKKSRPGHCFQGRYGAKLVEGDDYLVRLTRYIHLNPVKTSAMARLSQEERMVHLEEYPWSSYRSYVGLAPPQDILDYRWLKLMGRATRKGNQEAYRRYVAGFIADEDDVLIGAMKESRYAIGDERFRERTEEGVLGVRLHKADDGDIVWPEPKVIALDTITAAVADRFGIAEGDLLLRGKRVGTAKSVAIELCCRLSGCTQREVARHFAYGSESAVGKQRRMLAARLEKDPSLSRHLKQLARRLCL